MKLSQDLTWRGLIKDKTFHDIEWLDEPKSFYLGVDAASADSLTVGNLAIFMLARRLIDVGWEAILLVGGATSLIGDPKESEERTLKSRQEVAKNVEAIKRQIAKLFDGKQFTPADNYDWLKQVGYLDFLRDVGKKFTMSELMQREFITERLSSGISYAEFSYSLIQGYDYWQLYKQHKTVLQIGGSDQWGNMLSGVSLVRKKEAAEVHAMSIPLMVNKQTGQKFGKSEAGAIWLNEGKTSATDFHQFWINAADDDVEEYLKVFTLLNESEIEKVMIQHSDDPRKRAAQSCLADAVTTIVHGKATGISAAKATASIAGGKPTSTMKFPSGVTLVAAIVSSGLASSNSEARRLSEDKGIYINGQPAVVATLNAEDYQNSELVLQRGKRLGNSVLIKLE